MGIQISIPDPLKRQASSRRYGGQSRSGYSKCGGRSGGYGRSGRGGGYGRSRDERGGSGKNQTIKKVETATADITSLIIPR